MHAQVTSLAFHLASGCPLPLAPRPATKMEKYQTIAASLGIPWEAKTPTQLHHTLTAVRNRLVGIMPDGDPRAHENDLGDGEGEEDRVAGNVELDRGPDEGDDEDD